MREDAFCAYLAPLLGGKRSVSSYKSNAGLVERRLHVDLDRLDLSDVGVTTTRDQLIAAGVKPKEASDCVSALRQYARFRQAEE